MTRQRSIGYSDIFTPANLITLLGAALTVIGALHFYAISGLLCVIVGRTLDLIDGPVARRTHTSQFGAIFDATADKLAGLVLLFAVYHYKIVSIVVIALIFAYHLAVSVINVLIKTKVDVRTSTAGKATMFLHVVSISLFAISIHLHPPERSWLTIIAALIVVLSLWFAQKSIREYTHQYLKSASS
ncbi:MAG TPA: CDP-alcohol phosphatidyltransferase family protein [Verrucomicrobiae bacterium]|nr:CDP-alcohol phosphatidyltransferase family protein [Verrucomicrobiae bacterium]